MAALTHRNVAPHGEKENTAEKIRQMGSELEEVPWPPGSLLWPQP